MKTEIYVGILSIFPIISISIAIESFSKNIDYYNLIHIFSSFSAVYAISELRKFKIKIYNDQ